MRSKKIPLKIWNSKNPVARGAVWKMVESALSQHISWISAFELLFLVMPFTFSLSVQNLKFFSLSYFNHENSDNHFLLKVLIFRAGSFDASSPYVAFPLHLYHRHEALSTQTFLAPFLISILWEASFPCVNNDSHLLKMLCVPQTCNVKTGASFSIFLCTRRRRRT